MTHMPMGSMQNEVGLLLEREGKAILERADGGTWQLECTRRYRHLLGRRVRVTGARDGFDLIAVKTIEAV